jgi:uroporphyrinogen III methyltransferase/synthase
MIDASWSADTPAAVVQRPSDPQQRCLDASLGAVAAAATEAGLDGELLLFLGESVGKRSALSWFDTQPLFGQRVLVTRPAHQAAPTLAALRRRGAIGIPFATIAIEPPPDPARVAEAVRELAGYDVVVFTSDNGVGWFWREIERQGRDARAFGKAKLAAIGPATAAGLRARGIAADVVAETFVAEHLAAAILKAVGGRGGRVLLPRALVAREILPEMLRAAGMQVDVVPVYRTVGASAERRGELASLLDTVDLVMLTSSSTVEHLAAILGDEAAARLSGCKLASIGPITTKTAEMLGLRVWVSAEVSTAAGLIEKMERELRAGA